MEIVSRRRPSYKEATISDTTTDNGYSCYVLEDEIREIPGRPVSSWKVYGKTAIPAGRYRVIINMSARFKKDMMLLLDVPGFDGIRPHGGNFAADTLGCPLMGKAIGADGASVLQSTGAKNAMFALVKEALDRGEEVWWSFINPITTQA